MSAPTSSSGRIRECSARVACSDEYGALLRQKTRCMLSDCSKALHDHPRALQFEFNELTRHVDTCREAVAGRADVVEWNAAYRAGQSHGAAGFILNPAHAELIRSHVRARNVVRNVPDGARKGAYHLLLSIIRHSRVVEDHRFAPAMRQPGRGVLPGHCAGETEAFLGRNVRRHPNAANRRTTRSVVDHRNGSQSDTAPMNVNNPGRAEFIGKSE